MYKTWKEKNIWCEHNTVCSISLGPLSDLTSYFIYLFWSETSRSVKTSQLCRVWHIVNLYPSCRVFEFPWIIILDLFFYKGLNFESLIRERSVKNVNVRLRKEYKKVQRGGLKPLKIWNPSLWISPIDGYF